MSYFHAFAHATIPLHLTNFCLIIRTLSDRRGNEREKGAASGDRELFIFTLYTSEQLEILRASMIFNFYYYKKITWKQKLYSFVKHWVTDSPLYFSALYIFLLLQHISHYIIITSLHAPWHHGPCLVYLYNFSLEKRELHILHTQ